VMATANSFYTAALGRGWGGGGVRSALPHGGREGGLFGDRDPSAVAMGGMAMTWRWQVQQRMCE
jgi:hypothetical protein